MQSEQGSGSFLALAWHDVRDDVVDDLDRDRFATGTRNLVAQFEWLRENGYRPVSVDDLIAARDGLRPLPEKAVVLTFDDGLESFYERVFPLLRLYRWPAVLAVVGSWLEAPPGAAIHYADEDRPREAFMTWDELREVAGSGLVEIASHSGDLHQGIPGNPQGNLQPAAVTRRFDPASGSYESDAAFEARVRGDLRGNADLLEARLGRRPRVIVWPYGRFSGVTERIAREEGMEVSFGLEDGVNSPASLQGLFRFSITGNPPLGDFVWRLRHWPKLFGPARAVRVALDDLHDPEPAEREEKLGRLLDRIQALRVTEVHLEAGSRGPGGGIDAAYFPNRHLPVRSDLLNRAVWQLRTRAGVRVFARLPLGGPNPEITSEVAADLHEDLAEDLAKSAAIDGIVFEPETSPELVAELARCVRLHRPEARTARAVSLADFDAARLAAELNRVDRVIVELPPDLPERRLPELAGLVASLEGAPGAPARVLFELAAVDGAGRPVPAGTLARRMRRLQRSGLVHFGYGPDDFLADRPAAAVLRPAVSVESYPYERR